MVYQPPVGARDLFPLDVAQKRWIEDRLQQVFHGWGYHRIITSTLERLDTLMAGGAIDPTTVIQLQDREGEFLGLRPELTASIARAAVTRLAGAPYPQRLYYNANVFRRTARDTRQHEFYQAGVELLGAGSVAADAEMLLLVLDCLRNLNLNDSTVILGEAGLTRSLLSSFPEALRPAVRSAIAHLDRIQLEQLPLTDELRDRALLLLDLRGQPMDVLQRVSQLALATEQRATVNRLKSLMELLQQAIGSSPAQPNILLDLSLIQTFDYYTGIVFEAVSATGQQVLGQGGRYDQLLGLYHPKGESQPGIGFVMNIEGLHQVLLPTGCLPTQTPPSDWLVVPNSPESHGAAFTYAQKIRESDHRVRVEVELERSSPDEVRSYAQRRQIQQIVWIDPAGQPMIESID
ncbi:MAG: ATP phosphoribosyltransferase regulatory subunit [Elainella sp. Prado103]|jgi:ATP phosphoribosyltransferase regulatory subunit|nr:ATP phosphoribosyltransferase regulatory subunit [Elainella sp. Prado103]